MPAAHMIVHSDPGILGGTPVFFGTRVPARILFESLGGGDTVAEFLDQFSSVTREQALELIERAKRLIATGVLA